MTLWIVFNIIDWILFFAVALTVIYLFVFAIASLFNRHSSIPHAKHQNRFVVLIPAYHEDEKILHTVSSILSQNYPQRMFDVTVISDHQSEITNMHLAQYPITLLTPNFEKSAKAKSLQYAILNLPEFKIYDVVVVLDANNLVEPDFLERLNDAYENSGTKVILTHRLPRNRDTASARLDAIFEEINNSIFRRGHNTIGLSAAMNGSGVAFDFNWFKTNIMNVRTANEDKELESMLMRNHIFVDYFDDIYIYDEKTRHEDEFNKQRGRWATSQARTLFKNIHYLPSAIINRQYDFIDKIVQWMLLPRVFMVVIICLMSLILPFIYFTMAIKWWVAAFIAGLAFTLATPDQFVDKHWDADFLQLPFRTAKSLLHMSGIKFLN